MKRQRQKPSGHERINLQSETPKSKIPPLPPSTPVAGRIVLRKDDAQQPCKEVHITNDQLEELDHVYYRLKELHNLLVEADTSTDDDPPMAPIWWIGDILDRFDSVKKSVDRTIEERRKRFFGGVA